VTEVFTLFHAYSFRHPHFPPLHRKVYTPASALRERSPTPPRLRVKDAASADGLKVPTIIGATTLDW
jgi:hypothetical protein